MFTLHTLIKCFADMLLGPVARAAMLVADQDVQLILNPRISVQR